MIEAIYIIHACRVQVLLLKLLDFWHNIRIGTHQGEENIEHAQEERTVLHFDRRRLLYIQEELEVGRINRFGCKYVVER